MSRAIANRGHKVRYNRLTYVAVINVPTQTRPVWSRLVPGMKHSQRKLPSVL